MNEAKKALILEVLEELVNADAAKDVPLTPIARTKKRSAARSKRNPNHLALSQYAYNRAKELGVLPQLVEMFGGVAPIEER